MIDIDFITNEILKFSQDIVEIGGKISDTRIIDFEHRFNLKLPNDYKQLITKINGFSIMGSKVYGIYSDNIDENLESIYLYEHNEVQFPMFSYLVPFAPDGGGNFYCFDTRYETQNGSSCSVIFWVSNYNYQEDDSPKVEYESFLEYVKEVVIDWTLEDYNYDGSEKDEN